MHVVWILLPAVIYTSVGATVNYAECGRLRNRVRRHELDVHLHVTNGAKAVPHSYPWTALIVTRGELHGAGSLVTDTFLLTAAHVVNPHTVYLRSLRVLLGVDRNLEREANVLDVGIAWVRRHEKFKVTRSNSIFDIAVVKLDTTVTFNAYIQPICLPKPGSDYDEKLVIVAGWGRTKAGGSIASSLQEGHLVAISQSECSKAKLGCHVTADMICAKSLTQGRLQDACQGDSGGPLMFKNKESRMELAGIVSWGAKCADPDMPGVYTRVTSYLPWIQNSMTTYQPPGHR